MADGINISLPEVQQTAAAIRTTNEALAQALDQVKTQMTGTGQTWQSEAANTFRERFNSLTPRFTQYRDIVESYAKFLDSTVAGYEATEANINSAASSFK